MARRSRLSKSFQKRSRNTLILSILGIVLILFLLFKFGIPLLSDASFLFGKVTTAPNVNNESESKDEVFVPVPRLYSLPNSTNKKILTIKGSSLNGLTVEIYLNGNKVGNASVDDAGEFEKEVNLTEGDNIIKARAVKDNTKSDFSSSLTVRLSSEGPELLIESPNNGGDLKGGNPIEVKGTTNPGSTVTVNGFQAIINPEGKWSYRLILVDGGNDIAIVSIDDAGNKTEETIHVNYSQ